MTHVQINFVQDKTYFNFKLLKCKRKETEQNYFHQRNYR